MTQTSRRLLAVASGLFIAGINGGDKQSCTLGIVWTVGIFVILFVSHK
jgi:hypothetical protein